MRTECRVCDCPLRIDKVPTVEIRVENDVAEIYTKPAGVRVMRTPVVSLRMVRDRTVPYREAVSRSADVAALWAEIQGKDGEPDREQLWAVALTARNRPIAVMLVSQGTLTASIASPREVMKFVLLSNAAQLVLVHNHPSGDPEPSADDLRFTEAVAMAAKIFDVKLIDHVIVGDETHYSMADHHQL